MGRQVRGEVAAPRPGHLPAAGERLRGDQRVVRVVRRVALVAAADRRQVLPVGGRVFAVGRLHRTAERFRNELDDEVQREVELLRRHAVWERLDLAEVRHDRLRVVVAHHAEVLIRHHREERLAVAVDAFAQRAKDLAVAPLAEAVGRVGRDVLRRHDAGEADLLVEDVAARPLGPGLDREAVRGDVVGVAAEAVGDVLDEVPAAREALRRRVDLLRRRRPLRRLFQRKPRHRAGQQRDDHQQSGAQHLEERLHSFGTPFRNDVRRIVLSGGAAPRHEERKHVRKSDAG